MKIMLVGPYPPPYGGISVHIKRLKYYLVKKGHQCFVCNYGDISNANGDDIFSITSIKKIWKKKGNFFWETKRVNPEIIHIHHCGSGFFLEMRLIFLWKIMGKRIFITFHGGSLPKFISKAGRKDLMGLKLLVKMAEKIIHVNEKQRKALLDIIGRTKQNKLNIVSPFLPPINDDKQRIEFSSEVMKFYETKKEIITIIGGWRSYHKFECAVETLLLLLNDYCDVAMVFLLSSGGDIEYKKMILDLIKRAKIGNNILILEDVKNVAIYLKKSNIFMRTSSIDGNSVSILEALWFGISVIASDAVKRPEGVILFKDGEAKDLFWKIKNIRNNNLNLKWVKCRQTKEIESLLGIYS
ncbi:glycosyltransferase family 4 protein [Candidatus Pacearchaeota archaeon]|nr:glycosyltransferase family 4 protein [Candidatus Pacearchaeota archaeon]